MDVGFGFSGCLGVGAVGSFQPSLHLGRSGRERVWAKGHCSAFVGAGRVYLGGGLGVSGLGCSVTVATECG